MKILKNIFVLMLIIALMPIGCQKEEQLSIDTSMENTAHERKLKSENHTDFLNNLISHIEILVEEGYLNQGNGNALISKIRAAIKSLDKDNAKAANGQLNAFINQVEAFVKKGKLTSDQGEELIKTALKAIAGDFSLWECGDPFTDERDGQSYETVLIGDQ